PPGSIRLSGVQTHRRSLASDARALRSPKPSTLRPAGLRSEIKGEASACRRMPEDIHGAGLPVAAAPPATINVFEATTSPGRPPPDARRAATEKGRAMRGLSRFHQAG